MTIRSAKFSYNDVHAILGGRLSVDSGIEAPKPLRNLGCTITEVATPKDPQARIDQGAIITGHQVVFDHYCRLSCIDAVDQIGDFLGANGFDKEKLSLDLILARLLEGVK